MTAAVLAGETSLPLLTIQLDALITKYMGETAAKLRMVFDATEQTHGVYLFDEFDALGGRRAERNDVGEIRRVLNSFLQFLERDDSDSFIIAATNHPELLDHALFRRFDAVLEYKLPNSELAERVMRGTLAALDTTQIDWSQIKNAVKGLSHSDLTRACQFAAKEAILEGTTEISTESLMSALRERHSAE
jgi:AAA+ superfamily predicted ATPase